MPRKETYTSLLGEVLGDGDLAAANDNRTISNVFPTINNQPYRLAIIGEAPGKDEIETGRPFSGYSGRDLDSDLSRFGFLRQACFVGNICLHRPPGNKIACFDYDGPQIQGGLQTLRADLLQWRPNLCLLLGATALHSFKTPHLPLRKKFRKVGNQTEPFFAYPNQIGKWRGTFFYAHDQSPCPGVKCVASYHPAACLRNYEFKPVLMLDIQRCVEEAKSPQLYPPLRNIKINLSFEQTLWELDQILLHKPLIATDIEGGINTLSCISFATGADYAFIVPFTQINGLSFWSTDQETALWLKVEQVLSDPHIPKILQNGLYDRFVLQYSYQIVCKGCKEDTLVKNWEVYCEMRKSLAFLTSIYTKQPYYKEMRLQAEQREDEGDDNAD